MLRDDDGRIMRNSRAGQPARSDVSGDGVHRGHEAEIIPAATIENIHLLFEVSLNLLTIVCVW